MLSVTYLSKDRPSFLYKSLNSMLGQTVLPERIIVVDCSDGRTQIESTVDTIRSVTDITIDLVWRPKDQLSRSQGRNLGCSLSSTPIIVSTECDILYEHDLIEKSLACFTGNPIYLQPYIRLEREDGTYKLRKRHRSGFFQCFRREDFDKIGGYNPFLTEWGFEDADFKERMILHGCKEVTVDSIVTHMWHKPIEDRKRTNDMNKAISRSTYWDGKQWSKYD